MVLFCELCGTKFDQEYNFCYVCGNDLRAYVDGTTYWGIVCNMYPYIEGEAVYDHLRIQETDLDTCLGRIKETIQMDMSMTVYYLVSYQSSYSSEDRLHVKTFRSLRLKMGDFSEDLELGIDEGPKDLRLRK